MIDQDGRARPCRVHQRQLPIEYRLIPIGCQERNLRGDVTIAVSGKERGAPCVTRKVHNGAPQCHGKLVSPMPAAAARAQYQLGFFSGGYTGTAGTKPSRFGIWTFGRVLASRTSVSPMMPFR
jgi:hypothetical protein